MQLKYRLAILLPQLFMLPFTASALDGDTLNIKEVQITGRKSGLHASRISLLKVETINQAELCKAACCNLSESFETNPSVDVSYSDAATGAKQIKMLGLMGTYVQLLSEGVPFIRGLATPYGLSYVPGPWMESIQISKGAASVLNGYEAITGQINVEYKKPATSDLLSVNLFVADNLRKEANADLALKLSPFLSTSTFVHYENETKGHDANGDGFMDLPAVEQFSAFNRWYFNKNNFTSQFGVKVLKESRESGQMHTTHAENPYRIGIETKRLEVFAKNGYVFDSEKNTSVGLILSGSFHDQDGFFGLGSYKANQKNGYGNLIFQTDLSQHQKLVAGTSIMADRLEEDFLNKLSGQVGNVPQANSNRVEFTPGLFAEYSLTVMEKLRLMAGVRYDHSSWFNGFVTPRFHLKYDVTDWFHLRGNVGKGYRTTNVLSENSYMMASSREFQLQDDKLFFQEQAWNSGLSAMFYIPVNHKDLTLSLEAFNTNFTNQLLTDVDNNQHSVYFYALQGKSFSNVYQAELNYELFKGLQLVTALRFIDAQSTYNTNAGDPTAAYAGVLRERPLTGRYKGLVAASWQDPLKRWQIDTNIQFNGDGRLPDLDGNTNRRYKPFNIFNAQLTKYFRWGSIYGGGENLTGFRQQDPIAGADQPWGNNFDATMAWGPVHGSKFYVGLRYAIKSKKTETN